MERIRQLRQERDLSQAKLAVMAGMDPATLNRLEQGKGNPNLRTLQRVADALDVSITEILEADSPKAQPPQLPLEEGRGEAKERLSHWLEALQEQIMSRADKYGDEVEDENSPYFASANAATLWLAQVEDELAMWQDFSLKQTVPFLPKRRTEGWRAILDIDVWGPWFEAISPLVVFDAVIRDAKRRIEGMQDEPDELTARRLEKATATADESRERLEEWRRSASG